MNKLLLNLSLILLFSTQLNASESCIKLNHDINEHVGKQDQEQLDLALARVLGGGVDSESKHHDEKYQIQQEVSKLIAKGAKPNLDEALAVAIGYPGINENVRENIANDLLANGANPNAVLKLNENIVRIFEYIYGYGHMNDNSEFSPVIFCALNAKMLNILIKAGADINSVDSYGMTLLIKFVSYDKIVYQYLLYLLRDPNLQQHSPGSEIKYRNRLENFRKMIGTLLKNGANLDIKDKSGKTAFDYVQEEQGDKLVLNMLNNAKKIRDKKIKEALGESLIPDLVDIVRGY